MSLTPDMDLAAAYLNPDIAAVEGDPVLSTPCKIVMTEKDIVWYELSRGYTVVGAPVG